MTNLQQSIEQQVGVFVRNVSDLVRQAAIEALEHAVVVPAFPAGEVEHQHGRRKKKGSGKGRRRAARKPTQPRDQAALSAMTERLYAAITSHPGETMEVLAPEVGFPPGELRVSIGHLVARGRVKKAGRCRSTRYFPMDADRG
jgi:hypothetical protein